MPSQIQSPGTEFLHAETGGQKSALETADAHRDRKSGDDTGEIPAETAFLESPTKCAVWEDWMVGATGIEPIFGPKSHPADLPKIVLCSQGFLRYTFEIV